MDKLRGSHSPASPPPPLRSPPPSFISFFPFSFYCLGNGAALELRRAPASNFKGEEASACKGGGTRRSPGSPLSAPWGSKPAAGPRFTAKATRSRVTAGPGGTGSTGEVVKTKKSRINEKKKKIHLNFCLCLSKDAPTPLASLSPDAFVAQREPLPCKEATGEEQLTLGSKTLFLPSPHLSENLLPATLPRPH